MTTSSLRRGAPLLALVLALLTGCTAVQVAGHPEFVVRTRQTYAWSPASLAALETELSGPEETLTVEALRGAVDDQLRALDLVETTRGRCDLVLEAEVLVEAGTRTNDPYFDSFVAERYEDGRLRLTLRSRRDGELWWSGEAVQRLRITAYSTGGLDLAFQPTNRVREWDVEDLVDDILGALPRD